MNASAWPEWLSKAHLSRLLFVGNGRFSWSVGNESVANASVLKGALGLGTNLVEVNVGIQRDFRADPSSACTRAAKASG